MAGERIGRIYESLVYVAIQSAATSRAAGISVSWNPQIDTLMVQPDVLVGTVDSPALICLVTRSGARRNWHQKFWRNIGELVDVRAVFPTAGIASISLGTEPKEELVEILGALSDANIFPSRKERENIEAWAKSIESQSPARKDEIADYVRLELPKAPPEIRKFAQRLGSQLLQFEQSRTNRWTRASEWLAARRSEATKAAASWNAPGSVRRGLAKVLVFGPAEDVLAQIDSGNRPSEDLGQTMALFGWAEYSIGGWRITDDELLNLLESFDRTKILAILSRSISNELSTICADVSSSTWLTQTARFLEREYAKLKDPAWLARAFERSRSDPTLGVIAAAAPSPLAGSWMFRAAMALLKLAIGRKQAYGYEQLIGDIRSLAQDLARRAPIIKAGATVEQIRRAGSTDSLRRKLVDWVSGLRAAELQEWQILLVATVVADQYAGLESKTIIAACRAFPDFFRRVTYEDRIAPYRYFEPLRAIIELELEENRIPYVHEPRFPTMVSEVAAGGHGAGTTPVIFVRSTIIHWKSAHGSHHKTKELVGRGFSLRHIVDSGGAPKEKSGIKQLILVLEGDFRPTDITHLYQSGWDEVIAPNERVARHIV